MERQIMRTKGNRWCRLELRLQDGRLSICGSEGSIMTSARARAEARRYWESFFEESPGEMNSMNQRCGTAFRSPKSAARYVLDSDGELHGLDVAREEGGKVYVLEGCGQIVEELRKWFPEAVPYLKWHLNDMHAECEHQEARGETYKTHPDALCPDCGYRLGFQWLKRELPAEVVAWATNAPFFDPPAYVKQAKEVRP